MTGHKLINNYEVLRELGKGTHGKVKLARALGNDEENKVAIKIVKRFRQKRLKLGGRETQEDRVKKEIAVLKKARHHHVVSLLEVIDDPDADKVYMILEYVEEGEMKWRRKADKWTVDFERHRIEREKAAWANATPISAEEFDQEVVHFNSQREERAAEKRRILATQKQLALEMVSSPSRRSSTATILTDEEQHSRELAAKWSLEHGGDSESDFDHEILDRASSRLGWGPSTPSQDIFHERGDFQPSHGGLEVSTTFNNPWAPNSAPMSPHLGQGISHPSASQLSEEIETNKMFIAALKQIQREDDASTFDREDKPYRHVPCLTISRCRECFQDTICGLEYLHYQGIIHRDIKPANLLWDRQHRVKISDFGVSYLGRSPRGAGDDDPEPGVRGDDEVELARTVGTPAFYAPELCDPDLFADGRDNRHQIGTAMDVWALGVTLYCMIFARLPFDDPDNNEMALFRKIAKEDVFIPRMRPRAVRLRKTDGYEPKDRDEDALEYEAIGDELHDLLKRLLHKKPAERITVPEIKRHPWVVMGMENLTEWLDETDPENYISDKKIRVTKEDVSAAMQPISVFERMKQVGKRLSSLVRGKSPRGRDIKSRDASGNKDKSVSASSRASTGLSSGPSSRRGSLRGEELAYHLRASRPDTEHPLSQSQVASPIRDVHESYFGDSSTQNSSSDGLAALPSRPNPVPRGASTAESVMTIRASQSRGEIRWPPSASHDGIADSTYPAGSLNAITSVSPGSGNGTNFYGRNYSKAPSYGLASKRSSVSTHSYASSDDAHGSPSIAMSSETATGSVAPPSLLHEPGPPSSATQKDHAHFTYQHQRPRAHTQAAGRQRATSALVSPRPTGGLPQESSDDAFRRAQETTLRREDLDWLARVEAAESSRPTSRSAIKSNCPPSPDDEQLWSQQHVPNRSSVHGRPRSRTSTSTGFGHRHDLSTASSSADDATFSALFSDNSRHPSMPSVISSVASNSSDVQTRDFEETRKPQDSSRTARMGSFAKVHDSLMSTGETVTPARAGMLGIMDTADSGDAKQMSAAGAHGVDHSMTSGSLDDDEAGYVGDQDADEDSDDEGIVFGGRHI